MNGPTGQEIIIIANTTAATQAIGQGTITLAAETGLEVKNGSVCIAMLTTIPEELLATNVDYLKVGHS